MKEDISGHISELRELCIKMIGLLENMKENGKLSEKEYQQQIYLKKKFLEDTSPR